MKNIIIIVLVICIAILGGWIVYENASNHSASVANNDNVEASILIDKYYSQKLDTDLSSYELSAIADKYMNAWKKEFENVVKVIKEKLVFEQDKQIFDNYYKQCQDLALCSAEAEYLKYVDINQPIDNRFAGTGSSYSGILAMKEIYKQGAINLIEYYESFSENNSKYQYIFSEEN